MAPKPDALATFYIRQRDTLDFIIDLADWLSANGPATLSSATWAVAVDSPSTPVIEDDVYASYATAVVISPAVNAKVGDAYWLDVTLNITATQITNPGDLALPVRKLVRRINVVVVAG
ncbi:hypothetical protein D1O30_06900 [Methylocystis hirsuta]|uniref:Uncharacterized protein n=2 Tax=Methylocystis hirsuta TaxID=369798 RepID=A0A3M9XNY3_9HYPH|nr:hypothetical protein D1O30_06900 [Methylocystis hirsuta]